jgi:hypothetical protein
MKHAIIFTSTTLALAAIFTWTQPARAQTVPVVIDDFAHGMYQHTLGPGLPLQDQDFQSCSSCIGGFREVYFSINPENPFGRSTTLEIDTAAVPGRLLLDGGLKSFWGFYLIYGSTEQSNMLLDVNLDLYQNLVIDVDSVDVGVAVTIVLFSHNGNSATLSTWLDASPRAYTKVIPLAEFYEDPANPSDRTHIGEIVFGLQSGSAVSGDDFALDAIRLE